MCTAVTLINREKSMFCNYIHPLCHSGRCFCGVFFFYHNRLFRVTDSHKYRSMSPPEVFHLLIIHLCCLNWKHKVTNGKNELKCGLHGHMASQQKVWDNAYISTHSMSPTLGTRWRQTSCSQSPGRRHGICATPMGFQHFHSFTRTVRHTYMQTNRQTHPSAT